jgi:hypothetical protein
MAAADSCWYFVELRSSVVFGRKIFCFCCSASGVVGDVDVHFRSLAQVQSVFADGE